ncbi:transposase [Paenibacillus sp. F4]|uniref:transposase n=1 Tax=Paenibacillus sp. F4 TaxID=357385 RepID=UPI0021557BE9
MLASEGQSHLCLNAVLRAGNVHSSTEASPFLEETFSLLGQHWVQYARFDKGFGGEDFYSLWEGQQIDYVGKMKWTKRLAAEVAACRYWKRYVDEDWSGNPSICGAFTTSGVDGKLHQGSHSRTTALKLAKAFVNRHTWKQVEYRTALLE